MSDTKNKWHAIALVAGILLIAVNLRVPFTSIAPVLPLIQNDFGLSASALRPLLTSLPLLAFAAFSPLSASVARRFGIERTLSVHCWSFQRASCPAPQAAHGCCTPVRY
ncbi:hypothetical protein [Pseudomonas sp. H2_E05]